ncbi:MAG: L-ribulose-5-phosphate 3-epimerase [Chloroflexota bacterium]
MAQIPFGLYEKALPATLSWPERLDAAAKTGYDFVEISIDDSDQRIARLEWGPEEKLNLRRAIQNSGVPVKSMSLSAHRRFPLGSTSPELRNRGLDILKKAINFSVDLGIRFILIAGADAYHEESTPTTQINFLKGLERGVEWGSSAGVMLALENWDIQINSLTKAMSYVDYFKSPWFQVYADIGNLIYAGENIVKELEIARDHIAAVHIKDTLQGQLRYIQPGKGQVPFVDAFAKLAEIGFQGPIVLELWTENLPNAIEIASEANTWIRSKMKQGWQSHEKQSERVRSLT